MSNNSFDNFEYKGHLLKFEIVGNLISANCEELSYSFYDCGHNYEWMCNHFREWIDSLKPEFIEMMRKQKREGQMNTNQSKELERDILKKTRGVFKYVTSCYFKDHSSSKNELVQVGYLDLEDNIVFNGSDDEWIGDPAKLVRYLPGFMVIGYHSCEPYIPVTNSHNGKDNKEIREVISSNTIQYSPSSISSSPKVTYSVIGYLDDNDEVVYYNQIVDKVDKD